MAKTPHLIVLTGDVEAPFLIDVLRAHHRSVNVRTANSLDTLRTVTAELGPSARLIAYCTSVIVPPDVLGAFDLPSYNFHPGPPDYPGRYPAGFAAYDGATRFGITVHEMATRVDSGPIVATEYVAIPEGSNMDVFETRAYQLLATVFQNLAPRLLRTDMPLRHVMEYWRGQKRSKADFDALRTLTDDLSAQEILRRKQAFGPHVLSP